MGGSHADRAAAVVAGEGPVGRLLAPLLRVLGILFATGRVGEVYEGHLIVLWIPGIFSLCKKVPVELIVEHEALSDSVSDGVVLVNPDFFLTRLDRKAALAAIALVHPVVDRTDPFHHVLGILLVVMGKLFGWCVSRPVDDDESRLLLFEHWIEHAGKLGDTAADLERVMRATIGGDDNEIGLLHHGLILWVAIVQSHLELVGILGLGDLVLEQDCHLGVVVRLQVVGRVSIDDECVLLGGEGGGQRSQKKGEDEERSCHGLRVCQ